MMDHWWDMMGALDGFMEVLKSQNVHSHGIVSVFDDECLGIIQRDSLVSSWQTFYADPLGANWGGTPLFDAVNNMCRHLKELDPPRCSIVIVTDGHESDSTHTSAAEARAMLDWCRAKGWQVTFIGCEFDNLGQAKLLGANESNAIGVQKKLLPEAGKNFGHKRANYGRTGEDINFSPDERQKFGGYLSGPSGK